MRSRLYAFAVALVALAMYALPTSAQVDPGDPPWYPDQGALLDIYVYRQSPEPPHAQYPVPDAFVYCENVEGTLAVSFPTDQDGVVRYDIPAGSTWYCRVMGNNSLPLPIFGGAQEVVSVYDVAVGEHIFIDIPVYGSWIFAPIIHQGLHAIDGGAIGEAVCEPSNTPCSSP